MKTPPSDTGTNILNVITDIKHSMNMNINLMTSWWSLANAEGQLLVAIKNSCK